MLLCNNKKILIETSSNETKSISFFNFRPQKNKYCRYTIIIIIVIINIFLFLFVLYLFNIIKLKK